MNLKNLNHLINTGVNVNKLFEDNVKYSDLKEISELNEEAIAESYIHTSIKDFNYNVKYALISDDESIALVPKIRFENKIKYDFNRMILLEKDKLDTCDICKKSFPKDLLFNLYPELNNEVDDLKSEYIDFDGMICHDCYIAISKESVEN